MEIPGGAAQYHPDLVAALTEAEERDRPRWIFADLSKDYALLHRRGARLERAWDLRLVERIASRAENREPRFAPEEVDTDAGTLFEREPEPLDGESLLVDLQSRHLDQMRRAQSTGIATLPRLFAAESAGGLVAVEMAAQGIPFDQTVHNRVLTELIGPKPTAGFRPRKLQALADKVNEAFGRPVNPDSPKQMLAAFRADGLEVHSTHSWELHDHGHPGVKALKAYREQARIWTAFGWKWADEWVRDGRFHPVYTVGGADTGRWGTDGGGALQLPHAVREAFRAEKGMALVVADAAQLEPRLLAAISGDEQMIAATAADDLYTELAPQLGGEREKAKIALISAMYGGMAGDAASLVVLMRRRFPRAFDTVESAARTGERGGQVRTWWGRTVPAPSEKWWKRIYSDDGLQAARRRGRLTRNFIVQGTAAEWALVVLAALRRRLYEESLGDLVFFLHDEVMVYCPEERAEAVGRAVTESAEEATRTLFGDIPVRIPLRPKTVRSYADAK